MHTCIKEGLATYRGLAVATHESEEENAVWICGGLFLHWHFGPNSKCHKRPIVSLLCRVYIVMEPIFVKRESGGVWQKLKKTDIWKQQEPSVPGSLHHLQICRFLSSLFDLGEPCHQLCVGKANWFQQHLCMKVFRRRIGVVNNRREGLRVGNFSL